MRLIDADALIAECEEELKDESLWHDKDTTKDYAEGNDEGKRIIMTIIDEAPTIEPKRGEWIKDNSSPIAYRCTACNTLQHWSVIQNSKYNFCPNCGADMRKETIDYEHVVLTCDDEGNWSMHGERNDESQHEFVERDCICNSGEASRGEACYGCGYRKMLEDERQTDKGVSYSDHTDYDGPKTYVTWTEPQIERR